MTRFTASLLIATSLATVASAQSADPKVLEAQRLKRLKTLIDPEARTRVVAVGQAVPDFVLKDQQGTQVALSSLKGKVVAATFGYIRCPNPAYCFRLASNLGQLRTRLKDHIGRDLVLLTVMLDSEHDQSRELAEYAHVWTLRPDVWHFLTGPVPEVTRVAGLFGVAFLKEEGAVIHSLNTVLIDRHGRLAANLEGNAFSAERLIDLVKSALNTP